MVTATHHLTIAERTATACSITAQITKVATRSTIMASTYLTVGAVVNYSSRAKLITDSGNVQGGWCGRSTRHFSPACLAITRPASGCRSAWLRLRSSSSSPSAC
jgi:hypothetical protein